MLNKVVPRRKLNYDAIQILTTVDEPKPISKKSVQLEKLELLNTDIRSINFDISDVKTTPENNNLTSALVVEASVKELLNFDNMPIEIICSNDDNTEVVREDELTTDEKLFNFDNMPIEIICSNDDNIQVVSEEMLASDTDSHVSYDFYRLKIKEKHISFAILGHEECESCECFKLHDHNEENMNSECDICVTKIEHSYRYKNARELYKEHSDKSSKQKTECSTTATAAYYSADLQKVIMLPRVDSFKKVIFVRRLTAYHESFVPLGDKPINDTFSCIWHEAISGRNKEDIISTYYAFLISLRDIPHVVIWLDNCSSQNKNWTLLSFLIFFINSNQTATNIIDLFFFEPGHTFMSADNFHHQVESSLKKRKKIYDFNDFSDAIQYAKKDKIIVKQMQIEDFYLWKDNKSQLKTSKSANRVLLRDIVAIRAERSNFNLLYKTDLKKNDYQILDFLNKRHLKTTAMPGDKNEPCGIPITKKTDILEQLKQVLPENQKPFWKNLPSTNSN
ncbi:hypothetical protein ACI65C_004332 [Semiaphis heraclei]